MTTLSNSNKRCVVEDPISDADDDATTGPAAKRHASDGKADADAAAAESQYPKWHDLVNGATAAAAANNKRCMDADPIADDDDAAAKRHAPDGKAGADGAAVAGSTSALALQLEATRLQDTDFAPLGVEGCLRLARKLMADAERARTSQMPDYSLRTPADVWALIASHTDAATRKAMRATCTRLRTALHKRATRIRILIPAVLVVLEHQMAFLSHTVKLFTDKSYRSVTLDGCVRPEAFRLFCTHLGTGVGKLRLCNSNMKAAVVPYLGNSAAFNLSTLPAGSPRDVRLDLQCNKTGTDATRVMLNQQLQGGGTSTCNLRPMSTWLSALRVHNCGHLTDVLDALITSGQRLIVDTLDLRRLPHSRPVAISRKDASKYCFRRSMFAGDYIHWLEQFKRIKMCTRVKVDTEDAVIMLFYVMQASGSISSYWLAHGTLLVTVRVPFGHKKPQEYVYQQLTLLAVDRVATLQFKRVDVRVVMPTGEKWRYQPFMVDGIVRVLMPDRVKDSIH